MNAAGVKSAAEILVQGRVQGVGYRAFVQRKAGQLGLAGYVMNLKNGRVRVRVEGSRQSIEELTRDLEKGPPLARVESAVRDLAPAHRPLHVLRRPLRGVRRVTWPRPGARRLIGAGLLLPGLLLSHPLDTAAETSTVKTPPKRTAAKSCRRRRSRPGPAREEAAAKTQPQVTARQDSSRRVNP